jgi:DNA helicase-2/ATP-dependent DNA helicase PcrA
MPKIDLSTTPTQPAALPRAFVLSPEQAAALRWASEGTGNAILTAVAGAGKTSTLLELCQQIRSDDSRRGRLSGVVYCAFNKKIADEVAFKIQQRGIGGIKSATFHSLGFGAWRKVAPKVRVEAEKTELIMNGQQVPKELRPFVRSLVSLAKQHCVGIAGTPSGWQAYEALVDHYDLSEKLTSWDDDWSPGDDEDRQARGIEWAMKILQASNDKLLELIDFDDMLYAPLLRSAQLSQYTWVLIDEAQDTNTARRLLAERMLSPQGRLVAVGDPRQAIYGFTGADADSLDLIRNTFTAIELPLTVSFRCSKAVVAHAQRWVDHIQSADTAPQGSVGTISGEQFSKIVPDRTDVILCRITRPLIEMALDFLRRRIPAHVEGRDIGQSLIALCKKWRTATTIGVLRTRLEDYFQHESGRLVEKGLEHKIAQLQDRVDSLLAIMQDLADDDPTDKAIQLINSIFQDTDGKPIQSITLSTIHKAKGREWPRVYLYGRNLWMPHRMAKLEWQKEQEFNLIYVGVTRAQLDLVEVQVEGA